MDVDNSVRVPHPRSLPSLPKGTGAPPWPMGVFSPDHDTHSKKWAACSTGKGKVNAAEKGEGKK